MDRALSTPSWRLPAALAAVAVVASLAACSDGKAIKSPQSDTQTDDPDEPASGGTNPSTGTRSDGGGAATGDGGVVTTLALPNGGGGIGFEDLRFSPTLGRVIVPSGRTGDLDLIDPATLDVTAIAGFSSLSGFDGSHTDGTTSADEGGGLVFAMDQTSKKLQVVDPAQGKIIAFASLGNTPAFVRYVAPANEVWVTESGAQIEVFSVSSSSPPLLLRTAVVAAPGGPQGLVVDATRGRAYTHTSAGKTMSIDLTTHAVVETWDNGCAASTGIALDEARGFLIAGCNEGRVAVLDVAHAGASLSSVATGAGVDVIAYDPAHAHVYAPGSRAGTMAVLSVSATGQLTQLGSLTTAVGAHCVTVDGNSTTYLCDPPRGQLLVIHDPY